MVGLTTATLLMHVLFKNEDKFFNRVKRAQWQLLLVNLVLAIASLVLAFYFVSRHYSKEGYLNDPSANEPVLERSQSEVDPRPSPCAALMQA
mmetsp:Transcript_38506/g.58600  ORF Transcript_38506/g.58600 Transcript_38506/m.58600 type:complete len:92 (+) Transcript_38506:482-757(+)